MADNGVSARMSAGREKVEEGRFTVKVGADS